MKRTIPTLFFALALTGAGFAAGPMRPDDPLKQAADKTADATKDAAKDTAHGTRKAAHVVKKDTVKAADKTADATKVAAKDTAHGVKKAAKKTEDAVK